MPRRLAGLAQLVLLTLTTTPAPVLAEGPEVAFRGEGYLGYHTVEFLFLDEDAFQGGGAGSMSIAGESLYLQLDVGGDAIDYDNADADGFFAGGHAGWRDAELGSASVVGQFQLFDPGDANIDTWRAGAEFEAYLGPVTLGLEGGYSDLFDDAYVLGQGRVYVTEDVRLDLRVGAAGPADSNPLILVSAGGEFMVVPHAAFFARVESSQVDDFDFEETSVVAGARLYFGGGDGLSLKGHDRGFFQRACLGLNFVFRVC